MRVPKRCCSWQNGAILGKVTLFWGPHYCQAEMRWKLIRNGALYLSADFLDKMVILITPQPHAPPVVKYSLRRAWYWRSVSPYAICLVLTARIILGRALQGLVRRAGQEPSPS